MKRVALRIGEAWAVDPSAVGHDAGGMFLHMVDEPPENEDVGGGVVVVKIRGALSQFKSDGGDSYEGITERVTQAFEMDPKPRCVVLDIHSPGGAVAGLNECVRRLQTMSKASKVDLVGRVNEMAASAAYAIMCSCSEVLAPPSAIVGSVGVISQMVSIVAHDQAEGIEYRLITSGKRKADGHLHAPISDDAERAERARNSILAEQFFQLAGKARGISPAKLRSLEAAIYLGPEAKKLGLIDDVMPTDDVLHGLGATVIPGAPPAPNQGNVTDRVAPATPTDAEPVKKPLDAVRHGASTSTTTQRVNQDASEDTMSVKLNSLIRKTEEAIASETDPKKLRLLQAKLAAFTATSAEMDDGDDKNEDEDEDEDEESKSAKAAKAAEKAKAKAEAAKHRAKAAEYRQKMAECEEAANKCEAEDEDEDEAHLRTPHPSAGLSDGARAALASADELARTTAARLDAIERSAAAAQQTAMIDDALAKRRITRHEAKTLAKKPLSFVKDFLEMRPKAIIATSDEELRVPSANPANGDALPPTVEAAINEAMMCFSGASKEERAEIRASMVAAQTKRLNGAAATGERY